MEAQEVKEQQVEETNKVIIRRRKDKKTGEVEKIGDLLRRNILRVRVKFDKYERVVLNSRGTDIASCCNVAISNDLGSLAGVEKIELRKISFEAREQNPRKKMVTIPEMEITLKKL